MVEIDKQPKPTKLCDNCGASYSIEKKFCGKCGNPFPLPAEISAEVASKPTTETKPVLLVKQTETKRQDIAEVFKEGIEKILNMVPETENALRIQLENVVQMLNGFETKTEKEKQEMAMNIIDKLWELKFTLESTCVAEEKSGDMTKLISLKLVLENLNKFLRLMDEKIRTLNIMRENIGPNQQFHRSIHEMEFATSNVDLPPGTIVKVLGQGFMETNGKIIRKPRVIVAATKI